MYADARNCLQEGTMSEIESVKAVSCCDGIILDIRHTGHKFQVYLKNGQIYKNKMRNLVVFNIKKYMDFF